MTQLMWASADGRQCQAESLAGAAHLSNDNTGVLKQARLDQKPCMDQKGICLLD